MIDGRYILTDEATGISSHVRIRSAPEPSPGIGSPTGYEPRVLWSRERQAVYQRMRDEQHDKMTLLLSRADATVAGRPPYGDPGYSAAIAYQATGGRNYARAAWQEFRSRFGRPIDGDAVRQGATMLACCVEWIRPALTEAEYAEAVAEEDRIAGWCLGIDQPKYEGGMSAADSDATAGLFPFLALMDKLHGRDYLTRTTSAIAKANFSLGGLTPTGEGTIRDALARYAQLAEGGVWIESSGYNQNTLTLLKLGIEAVGPEHFPEYGSEWWEQIAYAQKAHITPDLAGVFDWGDVQDGGGIGYHLQYRLNLLYMLGENATADALVAKHKEQPWAMAYFLMDPYQESELPGPAEVNAPNIGIYIRKTENELFGVQFPAATGVHHSGTNGRWGDFALYRNGRWVIKPVVGYGTGANAPQHGNCLLLAGLSPMINRLSWAEDGKIIGETWGRFDHNVYNGPGPYVRLYRRTFDRDSSAIVITDDVDMDDPRTLPRYDRYKAAQRAAIEGNGLVEFCLQGPPEPGVVTWRDKRTSRDMGGSVRLSPEGYTGGAITLTTRVEVQ